MTMENIFAPDPQFRQGQYQKLSDNVNEWEGQIYSTLASIIPSRLGLKTALHWQKIDDSQGYAVGSVVLSDKSGKSLGVPLIVKQWHLAPLDTVMFDDRAYPLTPDALKELFSGTEIATDTIDKHGPGQLFDSGDMSESTSPPGGGKYSYSSEKSLLESLENTLWEEDISDLKDTVSREPEILASMAKRGTLELVEKVAKAKPKKKSKKNLKRSIVQISKNGVNEYSLLGNPEGVFDPLMHSVDRPTMKQFVQSVAGPGEAERELVSKIDRNQEVMIRVPSDVASKGKGSASGEPIGPQGNVLLYTEQGPVEPAVTCNSFGVYGMRDAAGVISYGYVFPHVVNFDGKKQGIKIFVGKNASAIQERFAGNPDPTREISLPKTELDPGKIGILAYIKDDKAVATTPFRVMSTRFFVGTKSATVKDFSGRDITLVFSPAAEAITKIKKSKDLGPSTEHVYVVPESMRFIELGPNKKLTEVPSDQKKFASLDKEASFLRIIKSNDRFIFKAAGLEKYANVNDVHFDFNALRANEAKFLLTSFGCSIEKAAQALVDTIANNRETRVYGLKFPKLASAEEVSPRDRFIRSLRSNIVKEASILDESLTVDSALSLNFINPDNVNKFSEAAPQLKETLSIICKMLVASRLGMNNIPEDAAQSAIHSIMRVLEGLKKLGLIKAKESV